MATSRTSLLMLGGALVTSTTITAGRCCNRKARPEVVSVQASLHGCGFAPKAASLFIHYPRGIGPNSISQSLPKSLVEIYQGAHLYIHFPLSGYYAALKDVIPVSRGGLIPTCIF